EPSGRIYTIQGATTSAYFRVEAWTGNFNSYAAAVAGGAPAAQTPVFRNIISEPPGTAPDLLSLPAMVLGVLEPSTFALVGLGCLLLLSRLRSRVRKAQVQ